MSAVTRLPAMVLAAVAACASSIAAPGQTLPTHRLPATLALEAVGEAVATCGRQGYAVSATVIDLDAVPAAVLRGDGAPVHTIEASREKAYAAGSFAPIFKLDSGGAVAALVQRINSSAPPGTLPFQPPEHMIVRAGGLTIKIGDEVIGAIGVGGAPGADLDEACARAGLAKIADRIK
jgi:uncharacterized protein GlcG (DUF336 family)